jgi:hypothetical protein
MLTINYTNAERGTIYSQARAKETQMRVLRKGFCDSRYLELSQARGT